MAADESKRVCEFCRFWHQEAGDTNLGQCRRMPPTPALGQGPQGQLAVMGSGFPPTRNNWWCGEWEQGSLVKGAKTIPFNTQNPNAN